MEKVSKKAKVDSLIQLSGDIIMDMEAHGAYKENKAFRKSPFLKTLAKHEEFLKDTSFYMILGIHILILFNYKSDEKFKYSWQFEGLRLLALLQALFALMILAIVILKRTLIA